MSALGFVQILAAFAGIFICSLVALFRRFGPGSWLLALFLLPASLAAGALFLSLPNTGWTVDQSLRLSFALLVAAAPLGVIVSYTINREGYATLLRQRRISIGIISAAAPVLIIALLAMSQPLVPDLPPGDVALGPGGYLSALYLILLSVIVLANLEQTLRGAQEYVRWEIKFLLLGLAGIFGSLLYIGSKVLLYSPVLGIVSGAALQLFPIMLLVSCPLILVSWKRSTGRERVTVSQGLIYSSITLLSVGLYLIVSSIVASWAGRWGDIGLPIEAALFLLSLLVLAVVLLWTDFRQRVKRWIRRHLLAGSYDYRQYWLEASERIQSTDTPQVASEALANIVQKAVGAIEVTVWLRVQNPSRLKLLTALGDTDCSAAAEVCGIVERCFNVNKPIPVEDLGREAAEEPMSVFLAETKASVLVPLQSSGRVVGLLTVGRDRSGQPYDWEALEFLGVLARHAAGELHKTELLSTLVEAKEVEAFQTFSTFLLHDLKNFASTLSLIAKNAARFQDNPDFQRDAFKSVFETAEKMKKLCNSLRSFSGAAATNRKLHNLSQIARAVADNLSVDLAGRLALDLAEVPPAFVDAEEIERVFQNLVLNAREAITAEGRITLRTRCHDDQVEVSIEDNGHGMSPEFVKDGLFLPFHTTKSDGLGIGLYQSKKIVEAHQGTIRVESREGEGTTVRLFLPVAQEIPAQAKADETRYTAR